jgi:NAD(P)-dependent dehydrogenase (short-subunit alcohol dehydrogenase family)
MGQVILLAGASKGIGLATARRLMGDGHTIYGTSRKPELADVDDVTLLPLDVRDSTSVAACVDRVLAEAGRIDVLINNAGYDLYGAAEETTLEELHAQMNTNFYGAVRLTQATLPHMREQRSGKIINTSSIGGLLSLPYNSAYAASKYALEGYSETLRYELLPFDIYVSLVQPGAVYTETLDTSIVQVMDGHPSYAEDRARMVEKMRRAGHEDSVSVEQVAAVVSRIVATDCPRLRYPVGNTARFVPMMKTLLPQRGFERFMMSQFMPSAKKM